jgi:gonadotropin-releasing hormone receptor
MDNKTLQTIREDNDGNGIEGNNDDVQQHAEMQKILNFVQLSRMIVVYSVLFAIAFITNSAMFIKLTILTFREKTTRIRTLIRQLSIADLLVAVFNMLMEAMAWNAGNATCKLLQFMRAFSLYFSSNVVIVICADRHAAVVHPIQRRVSHTWMRTAISGAWIVAAVSAIPQVRQT